MASYYGILAPPQLQRIANMNILLIGSGGREHALAWSIADSPLTQKLVIAPGNPGMAPYGDLVDSAADDIAGICDYAEKMSADLVVVGPEVPLVMGLVDALAKRNISAFGPSAAAAQLEGSKEFVNVITYRSQHFFLSPITAPPVSILRRWAPVW
jgi:phosphoribosylamine--glycine ligase